jgi:hypothetical protein
LSGVWTTEGSDTLAVVRRILASEGDPERRLDELVAQQRRDIEEQAARLEQTVADLERREQLLRDSRASLERLLRLGTNDLQARETELARLMRDVAEREERVNEAEAELARRREEVGAVELKRAALERRERALEEREEQLVRLEEAGAPAPGSSEPAVEAGGFVAFVPGAGYRLRDLNGVGVAPGASLSLDGEEYVVARVGRSPLPGDARRCAYLVRGPR